MSRTESRPLYGACQLHQKFKQSFERLAKIWAVKVNHGQMNDDMHAKDDGGVLFTL